MGLNNDIKYQNIFDLNFKNGNLVSDVFAFRLGLDFINRKSYLYYNITDADFPQAEYLNTSRTNYWSVPIKGMAVG